MQRANTVNVETEVKSFERVQATCDAAIADCDIAIMGLAVMVHGPEPHPQHE